MKKGGYVKKVIYPVVRKTNIPPYPWRIVMFGREWIPGIASRLKGKEESSGEARASQVERFIDVMKGILRFIDKNILINCRVFNDEDETRPILDYYTEQATPDRHEKGILVYLRNKDHIEPSTAVMEINRIFPHQQKQTKLVHHVRSGEEVYLMRDGKLIIFNRTGEVCDLPAYEARIDCFTLSKPREMNAIDLVRTYPDFEAAFLFYAKLAIVNAIKENEKKAPILKKVIDYINLAEKKAIDEQAFYKKLENDPNNVQVLLDLAGFLWKTKEDMGRARETYQQALNADPNRAETILKYSDFLFTNREVPLAKQLLAGLIEREPRNSKAYALYASAWMYEHVKEGDTRVPDEHGILNLVDTGDSVENQRYEDYYEKAIKLDPGNADAHHDYGFFLRWIKRDYDAALAEFKTSTDIKSEHIDGYLLDYAGILDGLNRDPAWVEALYRQALEAAPKRFDVYLCYHYFLLWTKHDLPAAEAVLKKAISLGTGGSICIYEYANFLHLVKHDLAGAELWCRKALDETFDTDQEMPPILSLNASVLFLNGKVDDGRRVLSRLFDVARSNSIISPELFPSLEAHRKWLDGFLLVAHYLALVYSPNDVERASNIASIKVMLSKGIIAQSFSQFNNDLGLHAEMLKKRGDPSFRFVRQLAKVIVGIRKMEKLEKYSEWRL